MIQHGIKKNKFKFFTATRLIVVGFGSIIFVGTMLLLLPFSQKSGGGIAFVDAFFTAASATCVTGLSAVDAYQTFTIFGQIVILCLIQIGGIGFMTLTSFVYFTISKKFTLASKLTMQEDIVNGNISYIKKIVVRILVLTVIIEGIGFIILSGAFSRYMPAGEAVWSGLFHSVSAFCNAGFSIVNMASGNNFIAFNSDPIILLTIAFLIIFGGLGFIVITDMVEAKRWRNYKLHTRIVLLVSLILTLLGTFFILGTEFHNPATMGNMSGGDKLLNAFFQSVTTRTAGFNSVNISSMTDASQLFLGLLMFIGASPGSTGGGIKTTTLFILVLTVMSVVRRKKFTVVRKQNISAKTIHKASSIFVLAIGIMIISVILLMFTENGNFTLQQILFEQISAYATVGLSLDVTPFLSVAGKIIIIFSMFLGRIGVLTFFIAFTKGKEVKDVKIKYPECSIDM